MNTQTNFQTPSPFANVQIGTQNQTNRSISSQQTRKSGEASSGSKSKKLHHKFVRWGRERNRLLNEMLAILPDIYKNGIWKKYANSIFEYAGKYGGLSDSAVKKRLRLEKHLQNKPVLKSAIKTAGVNKVDLVARLATSETDSAFADKVKHMSKSAVAELAKEVRVKSECGGSGVQELRNQKIGSERQECREQKIGVETQECRERQTRVGSQEIGIEGQECRAVPTKIKLELDEEMSGLFLRLKEKWGLTNKEIMKILLTNAVRTEFPPKRVSIKSMRTQTSKKVKSITGENLGKDVSNKSSVVSDGAAGSAVASAEAAACAPMESAKVATGKSRYINAYQKNAILAKHNHQCSYPSCNKPAQHLHHVDRWYRHKKHTNIIPLCKIHHEFAHNGLVENEKKDWRLDVYGRGESEADQIYKKCRSKACI